MTIDTRHSARRSKCFVGAISTLLGSAFAFAAIFGSMAIVHGTMSGGVAGALREGTGMIVIGGAVGLLVGGGIVMMAHCHAAITLGTLARMIMAGLMIGVMASAAGAWVSRGIDDCSFGAFPPAILGLAGTLVGICGAGMYLAEPEAHFAEAEPHGGPAERSVIVMPVMRWNEVDQAPKASRIDRPSRMEVRMDLAAWMPVAEGR